MKQLVSVFLAGVISLSIAGCSLLAKEEKKEETKQPPKQEQSQQQNQNPSKTDSVLQDSKPMEVNSMKIYVDDRNWTSKPGRKGKYEVIPGAHGSEEASEAIWVWVVQKPFPRLDQEEGPKWVVKEVFGPISPESLQYETLKSEPNEIMLRFQMKSGGEIVTEGFMRAFGNDQKSGLVVYMNMDGANKEKMEKWQKRIEASRFAGSQ